MSRRTLDWHALNEAVADARMLHERGCERAGNWDLAQCLGHLTMFFDASIDGFPVQLPNIVGWSMQKAGALRRVLKKRRMPSGLPAPKPMRIAAPSSDRAEEARAVERFAQAVQRFQQHAGPHARSPVLGTLDHQAWNDLHIIHAMHHLSFLSPVAR